MIKQFLSNRFVRNVILVASGTAGAQIIAIVFAPIITRLYGPEAFGLFSMFIATLNVVMPAAALSYPIAIVLPKSDNDALGIAKLSCYLALIISSILGFVLYFYNKTIANLLGLENISTYLLLIPLAMFFDVIRQVLQQWLIRKKQFRVTAQVAVSQALILYTTKTGVGLFYPAGFVLIFLATLGKALYPMQLWFGMNKWVKERERINNTKKASNLKVLAFKYRDFALYRTPQVLINSISQGLPVLILAGFFGPSIGGFFTLGKIILSAPATLIGSSVGNVFYQKIAESVNKGEDVKKLLNKATIVTFALGLGPLLIVILFGEVIFQFVFGQEWIVAGQYARWMALWVLASLAARPLIATIPVIKIQGVFLVFEIVFLFLKLLCLIIPSYIFNNALMAVAFYSLVTASSYIVLYILTLLILKRRTSEC